MFYQVWRKLLQSNMMGSAFLIAFNSWQSITLWLTSASTGIRIMSASKHFHFVLSHIPISMSYFFVQSINEWGIFLLRLIETPLHTNVRRTWPSLQLHSRSTSTSSKHYSNKTIKQCQTNTTQATCSTPTNFWRKHTWNFKHSYAKPGTFFHWKTSCNSYSSFRRNGYYSLGSSRMRTCPTSSLRSIRKYSLIGTSRILYTSGESYATQ